MRFHGQPGHSVFQHGVSEISYVQSSSTPHSSGVETSNSARIQMYFCGDASQSNEWCLQETHWVPRVVIWVMCISKSRTFVFSVLNWLNWNWKKSGFFYVYIVLICVKIK
jgi:hypothetical protein